MRVGEEVQDGEVAFSVISIEPERNSRQRGSQYRRSGVEAEEEEEEEGGDGERRVGARAYEDENEMLSRQVRNVTQR